MIWRAPVFILTLTATKLHWTLWICLFAIKRKVLGSIYTSAHVWFTQQWYSQKLEHLLHMKFLHNSPVHDKSFQNYFAFTHLWKQPKMLYAYARPVFSSVTLLVNIFCRNMKMCSQQLNANVEFVVLQDV